MNLGNLTFKTPIILAPMAGVTDRPFRQICRDHGADFAVSEMVKANTQLHATVKTQHRLDHQGESRPHSIQILGNDPAAMALAAAQNAAKGVDFIDINMGCPAKKVLKKAAGSALLSDPQQVRKILEAVVAAVNIPVTLKIRTGTDAQNINASEIAKIAEESGIQALAVHGRTREQRFSGDAEYDTIAKLVQERNIPVLANGDINCAERAAFVLEHTKAAGLLIGRGAQGNPWIFTQIKHYLSTKQLLPKPSNATIYQTLSQHIDALELFYGEFKANHIARKHIAWYGSGVAGAAALRAKVNKCENLSQTRRVVHHHFMELALRWAA